MPDVDMPAQNPPRSLFIRARGQGSWLSRAGQFVTRRQVCLVVRLDHLPALGHLWLAEEVTSCPSQPRDAKVTPAAASVRVPAHFASPSPGIEWHVATLAINCL